MPTIRVNPGKQTTRNLVFLWTSPSIHSDADDRIPRQQIHPRQEAKAKDNTACFVDRADEVAGLRVRCRVELYNGIKNVGTLGGSMLAKLWVEVAGLPLGEVGHIRFDLSRDVTGQIPWKMAPRLQAKSLGNVVSM